ncbi:MAG: hypothetical protein IME96_10550 [Proteobacteria bacterium]|nr:hypothetical protein [Pseudomonadota bacterium]
MKSFAKYLTVFVTAIIILYGISAGNAFAEEDRSEEINKYLTLLQSKSITQRVTVAKLITRSGLSDKALFDYINKDLLNRYQQNVPDKPVKYDMDEDDEWMVSGQSDADKLHIDEMAWLCKALASSGLSEYKGTLEEVAYTTASPKLKQYAKQSIRLVDEYAERNAIMAKGNNSIQGLSPAKTRLINMLKSDNYSLKRDAAKMLIRSGESDEVLYEVVNEELLKSHSLKTGSNLHIDAMAWMCKALGSSGISKYRKTLQEIIETTKNTKLKTYAKQNLNLLN